MLKNLKLIAVLLLAGQLNANAQTTRVQIIHNAADLAADTVDVWVNGARALPNFAFRTATPFIDLPAGVQLNIHITAPGAADTNAAVFVKRVTLSANESYVVVANGIVSASGYTPATPFDLYVYNQARETSNVAGEVDVLVFHGSTDAPAVDVNELSVPVPQLVPNLAYGNFAGYLGLAPLDYSLGIAPAGGNNIAQFGAPLQTLNLGGAALVVVASGFLDPTQNSNGPAFGLYVASPAGGPLLALPAVASSTRNIDANSFKVFPNPVKDVFQINYDNDLVGARVVLTDMQGRVVYQNQLPVGANQLQVDATGLTPGLYMGKMEQAGKMAAFKVMVQP